ncbi:Actin/actin-like protein [Rozella allomycis CSF55]|uniref:Actin/actin-like protein n=1 Tax=Rozella allomycis (strain CSF55) TaxID=988480 RepID=A0A4P9YL50_ROZAC|nr:Actin/actin-like protein [Rozella allomycis CSF55]
MSSIFDALTSQPIVIDNGSGIIKSGFSGDNQPKSVIPAIVGRTKYKQVMTGSNIPNNENFIGNKAMEYRGLLKLNYPMEHGMIEDWTDMELIWSYIFSQELKVSPEEHPILLTEAPLNSRKHREKVAQVFFETFNVPAMYMSIQAVLSLYASGRTTGVVVDIGDGVSHVVPIYEGYTIPQAIQRADIAGRDVTRHLQYLLRKSGYPFFTSSEFEVVRTIKEKYCYVSNSPSKDSSNNQELYYSLPDGNVIKLNTERHLAPEILFTPELIGNECPPVNKMVLDSIKKVDLDLRRDLYGNIVLSGGTTLTKGFPERLLSEIEKEFPRKDVKVRIFAPPERKYSSWIGGSILSSLSTFKKLWVTSEEYDEDPGIIHRKIF